MKRFFVLEGPDATGKTTAGKALRAYIQKIYDARAIYYHCDANKSLLQCMKAYQTTVVENMLQTMEENETSIILDRAWPSNIVYGKVFNNQEVVDWTVMKNALRAFGVTYIFTECDSCVARHRENRDPKHPYDDTPYLKVVHEYKLLRQELALTDNVVVYDIDKMPLSTLINNLGL